MNVLLSRRRLAYAFAAATVAAATLPVTGPTASAGPCPDVEIIFARGTGEAPGVGGVGQAFVDAVRSQAGDRSVAVYPVNYAASGDFNDRAGVVRTVSDGVRDESNHIQATAQNCPNTRMVLGGYSQGAAVTGFTTADTPPAGVPASEVPPPMPPGVADHVAAVALFGKPSPAFLQTFGAPSIDIGPLYAPKITDLCAPGDTICDDSPGGAPSVAHALYPVDGLVTQAATFVVGRL
jgi:cutinase